MGTLRLTLMRHGQAQAIDSCPEDFERSLTHRGNFEVREMAGRLMRRKWVPDLILASPAERTFASATILAGICELEAKQVELARELYLATAETAWQVVMHRAQRFVHVLVCGHNPGLSEMASRLGPTPQPRELRTAGLATAVWRAPHGGWSELLPEAAVRCDVDDPDTLADLWEAG